MHNGIQTVFSYCSLISVKVCFSWIKGHSPAYVIVMYNITVLFTYRAHARPHAPKLEEASDWLSSYWRLEA